jgi:hypothetical protein
MARTRNGQLSAADISVAAGASMKMLRAMWECGLIPTRGYTSADAVVAKMARHVWYAGGARALPSDPAGRQAAEGRAVRAGAMLRRAILDGKVTATTRLIVTLDPTGEANDLALVGEAWQLLEALATPGDHLDLAVGAWLAAMTPADRVAA